MYYFLLSLLLLDALLLMVVVLLQAGKGGGLAAMGAAGAGSDSMFGSRQAVTLLTRATWWTGGIFMALAFMLSLLSGRSAQSESILRSGVQPAPVTSPVIPGTFEPAPGTAAPEAAEPAAPTAPATPEAPPAQ